MDERKPSSPGETEQRVSRRGLFRGLGAGAASVGLLQVASSAVAAEEAYKPQYFTDEEIDFLNAACDRLIPKDDLGGGAIEAGVPIYIDKQMMTPYGDAATSYMQGPFVPDAIPEMGFQHNLTPKQIYRLGIADVNAYANQSLKADFAKLTAEQMDQLLGALEKDEAKLSQIPAKLFFSQLLQNTREGFFCDPIHGGNRGLIGWTLIGFPGARADYMDWISRNEKYPFPAVSIDGTRAKS